MSQRGDRGEGHARRPGRSSNFGGHRGGGVGGGGKGGGGPSGQPPLSSNRSFRKPGNGHGGYPRVVNQPDTTGFQPAPAPIHLQTPLRPPAPQNVPGGSGHVPVPAPRPQHHDSSGVRAPALTPAIENTANVPRPKSIPHAAPKAPSRISNTSASQGASKGELPVDFQFGTVNLNVIPHPHFPARTSSAPPNLDEQKRMQALPDGHKVAPSVLVPPALKQQPQQQKQQLQPQQQKQQLQPPPQQTRKDAVSSSQPNPVNPHLPSQVKRDVHVSTSLPNVPPPRPPVQQLTGMAMSMHYHHQAPMQFGGHNSQIPPQSVVPSSLQMPMMHGGNAPQVPQNIYVPSIPHHQLQQTTMMHQPQSIPYVPSANQLTTQLGNIMNVGVGPQYPQPPNKFVAPRKTPVKITHPDTHEELKLDKRMDSSGQRGLPNVQQQTQPVSTYGTHMGFYPSIQPNSYNQSAMFYSSTAGVSQIPTVSQGPRFTYPVTQAGQAIPFISPSTSTVPGSNKDITAGPTASSGHSQVTGKVHPTGLQMEKPGAPTVTISAPPGKSDAPKLRPTEDVVSHRQKDSQSVSVVAKSGSENESKAPLITEKHATLVSKPLTAQCANTDTTAPASLVVKEYGADRKSKEAIERTESFKDSNKNATNSTKKDTRNLTQQPQAASSVEDLKVHTSLKVVCDGVCAMEGESVNKELELTNSASPALSESRISPGVNTTETDSKSLKAVDVSSTDRRLASESTEKPQVGKLDVVAVESEQSEITRKISPDLTEDEISPDSTGNVSHEVCTLGWADLSPVRASNPDNSDTTTCVTDRGQLFKESATSVSDEHVIMNSSHQNTEKLPESAGGIVASMASSETSSESTIENANISNQETGSDISSTIPDALAETHSVATEGPQKLESMVKDQSGAATTSFRPASREKPSMEIARMKSSTGKKKKRKEMLSKADAAGSSDLYNAYKGPEEKLESIGTIESTVTSSIDDHELLDESEREGNMGENEGKKTVEPDDWEDADDMTTKLESSDCRNQASVVQESDADKTEASGRKRYSRDFLLTLAPYCTNLPVGFQMVEFASALFPNLAGKSYVVDHPSPGRGIDRPTSRGDRRGAAMEDDRWGKSGHSFGSGRDMPLDNGPPAINHRGAPGGNHGVLRNPRGGLLVGPIAPQMIRSGSDADRWQQKGLFPSPVTPMQVMHKAEKKYVVGKASDEEESKQRQLKAILNKLTPQNFEKLFEKVKEVNIDSVATLNGVISQIFDKALMEPTFCEMYANFCFHLAGALPDFSEGIEKITFKRLLLNKCQEEFERGEREEAEADKTEEGEIKQTKEEREEKRVQARRRMLGNIRLIGELYKQRMLTDRIMHDCVKKLLGDYQNNPDEENIEALCKLMSTIGEMIDHAKAKEHMDAYFDIMHKLSTSQQLSSRVRFMLRDSIDLRKNKWQQRRKVEGPKKIEEVHRDAAHERHVQSSRLARGSVVGSAPRRGAAPMDYGPRGSAAALASSSQQFGFRGTPSHSRGHTQDIRLEEKHSSDNRTVPLPQRKDGAITLGPQGGLARDMSIKGQPPISNAELSSAVDNCRTVSGPNGYNSVVSTAREEPTLRIPDRSGRTAPDTQFAGPSHRPASQEGHSGNKSYSKEDLRVKSISAIQEYYSAKDDKEVALCIEELNAPSFYPSVVSLWINDSFERKDLERELLTKLLVSLCNGRNNLLSKPQLIEGLVSVLASLEDALSDAPRAAEYLGRLLARFVVESILSLQEVGTLVEQGGEESGDLVRHGIAADVLGVVLESIRVEKGDSFLKEAKTSSKLKLEDFRPQHLKRSKLDPFM
ncbi:hypothetical protein ABZP36_001028 [Zizania latifolia]